MLASNDRAGVVVCPTSGVVGLTPHQVRDRMIALGWNCLPIAAHDVPGKGAGKRPGIPKWERFASFEGAKRPCEGQLDHWGAHEVDWPGTGIPCGEVIAIDIDVSDPVLASELQAIAFEVFGETPFVRQGSAPKVCLIYRAAEPIPKRALKANDGSGDGLDIIGEGAQFVAFGLHARTCRPYEWRGAETPLTASPHAAPEITNEQIDEFVERARALLPLTKTGGRRGEGGISAEIVRDAEGLVVDGREAHLTRLVWRSAAELHSAGLPLTEAAVVENAWAEFERTARVEVGGRRWTRDDCASKARGTLDRIRRKVVALPARRGIVEATYADDALSLPEAEAEVARLVGNFFEKEVSAYGNARRLYELAHDSNPLALPPAPCGVALRVEAGIGKTEAAIRLASSAVRRGVGVVYSVPTVELGDAIATRFEAAGVGARVWRGREQADPEAPGHRMCRDLQAVADARKAGAYSVAGAVCSRRVGGQLRKCRFFDVCGHVRQRTHAEPQIWIITHAMLLRARPAAIQMPEALVIDESFAGKAIPDKALKLAVDVIERAALPEEADAAQTLQRSRRALVEALRIAPEGPLQSDPLSNLGIDACAARKAAKLEWKRYAEPGIVPGLRAAERTDRVEAVAGSNAEVKALAGLWAEIADFLEGDFTASGRLVVAETKGGGRVVSRRSLRVVDGSWHCPTLILDATAPPPDVLSTALGLPVDLRASIRARWSEHGRVRQIIGAPVSSNALGANGQGGGERSLADLARYVALRGAFAFPAKVGVVIQKDLVERFEAHDLGANVEVRHFGALAGLDHWRDLGGAILIGRTAPPPGSMEAAAGVLRGEPVERCAEPFADGGILLRDGTVESVSRIRLSYPMAEALRWQVCEANLIQAAGRIRPLRRDAAAPFFLDILCDVPLPLVVDEVARWEAAKPGAWARMAAGGVVFTSAADAEAVFGISRQEARTLVEGATMVDTSKAESTLDVATIVKPVRKATIKRRGRQYQSAEVFLLPNAPLDRKALRLGPLRPLGSLRLEIDGEPSTKTLADFIRAHGSSLLRATEFLKARAEERSRIVADSVEAVATTDRLE